MKAGRSCTYDFSFQCEEKGFLTCSLKAMEENPEIWKYYFSDFISSMLHLESTDGISQHILRAFFVDLEEEKRILERLVQLYVYMDVYHFELAKMATILRPLDHIQHVENSSFIAFSPTKSSPTEELLDVVQQTKQPLGTAKHLSAFVVSHLFNALMGAVYGQAKSPSSQSNAEKMLKWYKAYRCVNTYISVIVENYLYLLIFKCYNSQFNARILNFTGM